MILGLMGKANSGKDTAYSFISNYCRDYKVISYSFASFLKNFCSDVFGINIENFSNHETKSQLSSLSFNCLPQFRDQKYRNLCEKKMTNREVLQYTADFLKTISPNIFCDIVFRKILNDKPDIAVITDVRFLNEAQRIFDYGGLVLKIIRNSNNLDTHISENEIDICPYTSVIYNNGSLGQFKSSIVYFLEENVISKK
ncbi:MAG: hypothetical protein SNJ71_02130 [Bacteroidales bacterium]